MKPADAPPKEEAKPAEKAIEFTSVPRLTARWDLQVADAWKVLWSPDGGSVAAVGVESSDLKNQRPVFYLIQYPGKSDPRDRIRTLLPTDGHFVGFSPDGKFAITDLREYHLLSGYHRLTWWDPSKAEARGPFELRGAAKVRTVDFDGADLHGYAFTRDGKTFRTIRNEYDAKGAVTSAEVVELDATTGKTGKVLLKLGAGNPLFTPAPVFSPDATRLAVIDKDHTKVLVYDLDRGTKLSEYAFQGEKPANEDLILRVVFSQDGKRLVVARSVGQLSVVNADTGEPLPALEGLANVSTSPHPQAFSGDGRLLVLSGSYREPLGKGGSARPGRTFLTVWDTRTGKIVKSWNRSPQVAFCPTRPVLAMLEGNGENATRIGFWDFAEVEKK
jgi:WD40 repeat protein